MLPVKLDHFLVNVSLTKKMLIIVTFLGTIIWFIHDQILTTNVEKIFNTQLNEQLNVLTSSSRIRFDRNLRKFKTLINIFHFHPGLIDYLKKTSPNISTEKIKSYTRPPKWFPQRSIIRNLIHPRFVLLLAPNGKVIEIYQSWEKNIPPSLLTLDNNLLESTYNQVRLTEIDEHPFVIISDKIAINSGKTYSVVFATPMDDELLISLQNSQQAREIIALVDTDRDNAVIASSHPNKVKSGDTVAELEKSYVLSGKAFFDYGASDLKISLTTLVPTEQIRNNMQSLINSERKKYVFFAIVYMLAAYVLGMFAVRRINHVTNRIKQFSSEFDHQYPRAIDAGGDQLFELENHFYALVTIIRDAHKGLRNTAQQLQIEKEEQGKLINELEETHEQLVQADKMASLGSLVAGVSHEINTPIGVSMTGVTYIQRETQFIREKLNRNEITKKQLDEYIEANEMMTKSIILSLNKANELVRSFKQVAVDQNSEVKRRFNLHDYLNDILLSLHSKTKQTQINLNNKIDENLQINSYPGIFSQIFTNLITNSLIHGFEGKNDRIGEIHISGYIENQKLNIYYSDNGVGLEEKLLARIFEPFFTTKMGQGGSGLGMYITYNLVTQKLGGYIKAENAPQSGIHFYIQIPCF